MNKLHWGFSFFLKSCLFSLPVHKTFPFYFTRFSWNIQAVWIKKWQARINPLTPIYGGLACTL